MGELEGKVAIVTGGSRGIGAGIARRLGADGAKVVVHCRQNVEAAQEVVKAIESAGGSAVVVAGDLGEPETVERVFARVDEAFGRLDILVNNAGAVGMAPLEEIDRRHYDLVMDVNVWAAVAACREAARRFGEEGGRIVNISSLNGRIASPSVSVYAASKAALESFTRSFAAELGPRGITVNAVAPGFTETDMLAAANPRENWPRMAQQTALRRIGKPEDIAEVVAFLASARGRWITGQVLAADGGLWAW